MTHQTGDFSLQIKALDQAGSFSGYASVFGVIDGQKDVILRGAFTRTLTAKKRHKAIKLLWQHRMDEPIGIVEVLREDSRGLYMEAKLLLDVARAREAYELLKNGALEGLSIGYSVVDSEIDSIKGIRLLKEVELHEISLVTFPANAHAKVTQVKQNNLPLTVREFEQFLRDAGFSRNHAKAISLHGFKASDAQRDVADDELDMCDAQRCIDAINRTIRVALTPNY